MSEQNGDVPQFRFDIAVSFAGEDRDLVEEIVGLAKEQGVSVFYDDDFRVESWGKDLVEHFANVYQHQARYAVMFVSLHYAEKVWTRLERRSILARALNEGSEYALPVRFDDTVLDGLLPTVGYLDARREGARGIADAIVQKVSGLTENPVVEWTSGAPETESGNQKLLALRPPGWEYLYYAGLLSQGCQRLEPRYLDVEVGFAKPRAVLEGRQAYDYLSTILARYAALADMFEAALSSSGQERAFGIPGEEGDPGRIAHLAQRLLDVYSEFLSISEDVRGTIVPEPLVAARDAAARAALKPLNGIQAFVSDFAAQVAEFPQLLAAGENLTLEMTATIEVDEEVLSDFTSAMAEAIDHLD